MAVERLFLDNVVYGAEDVNRAFSRLTTQGVSLFQNTGAPLVDLNTAVSNLVESGVELHNMDACKVVKTNGEYQVLPGTAWMADGSCITISDEPYHLDITSGAEQYVYFRGNAPMNTIDIAVSGSGFPQDALPLALVAADGTVTDRRTYAKTKVAPATGNIVVEKQTGQFYMNTTDYVSVNVDVGYGAFSHVRLWYDAYDKLYLAHEHITLENGVEQSMELIQASSSGSNTCFAKITKNDNILSMSFRSKVTMSGSHNFSLIVF